MANYSVKITGNLDTTTITEKLKDWEVKNGTVKIDADTGALISAIDRLQDGMGKVATVTQSNGKTIATITDNTRKWTEQQENLRSKIQLSTQQLERMSATANNLSNRWGANSQGVQQVQSRISALQNEYNALLNSTNALDSATVRQLNNQQREIQESISLMRTQSQGMTSSFSGVAQFTAQFISIQKTIQLTITMIRNMIDEVFKLDASLTELAKVSNMVKSEMGEVTEKAFELGDEIGRTGREVIDATTEFKRAGYAMNEAFDLGETALVMTNIADGIDNTSEAATNLISIMKGFNIASSDSMHIIDAFNNVSNNMATTYANLVDVMQRSSATLSQAGVSLEQGIGLATGALEILGDKPEQVGRALNSLTQRLRGLTEVGEDGYEGVSKLNDALESITGKYGKAVSVFDNQGNLRSTFEILKDLSEVYPKLTENERQFIGEKAAGKHSVLPDCTEMCIETDLIDGNQLRAFDTKPNIEMYLVA